MNNHDDISKLLSAYAGGDLGSAERMQVEEHLAGCASCRTELADLQTALRMIRTFPESDPPPWLAARVMARVREQQLGKRSWLQRIFIPLHIKLPIEALALLLVCVSGYYMARNVETELQQPTSQQEIPAPIPVTSKPDGSFRQEAPAATQHTTAAPSATRKEQFIPVQPSATKTTDQVAPQYSPLLPAKPSPQPTFAPAPPAMKEEGSVPAAESSYRDTKSIKARQSLEPADRAMPAAGEMKRKTLSKGNHEKLKSEETYGASGAPSGVALPQIRIRLSLNAPASAPGSLKEAVIRSSGTVVDDSTAQHTSIKARIPANRLDKLFEHLGGLGRIVERPLTRDLQGFVEIEIIW